MIASSLSCVLVSSENSLRPGGGGVQVCTQDYLWLLKQAGMDLRVIPFSYDRSFASRMLRRAKRLPYAWPAPSLVPEVVKAVEQAKAQVVFFNQGDFPLLAAALRQRFKEGVKLVHLSHGLDSTDLCIAQQSKRESEGKLAFDAGAARQLGAKLQFEADYRRHLDAALCIAPLDAEVERWLGVRRTAWFSRPIRETPLSPNPIQGRVGCVATLDHPPNQSGLLQLLQELRQRVDGSFAFRLVGGPEEQGKEFAARFPFVQYLGRLGNSQLREEATTWVSFVHPIFHYARGCSTKVAVALGWEVPLATTIAGTRGYLWSEEILPLAHTSRAMVPLVLARSDVNGYEQFRAQTQRIKNMQPSTHALVDQMRSFLSDALDLPMPAIPTRMQDFAST